MNIEPAITLIKEFEGLKLHAYRDSVGVPTIGWGHTKGTHLGMIISMAEASAFLLADVRAVEPHLDSMVKVPMSTGERCALLSFCFNLGTGSLYHSHLLYYLNAGNRTEAAEQFLRWDHAGGQRLAGLTRRRKAERALFLDKDIT